MTTKGVREKQTKNQSRKYEEINEAPLCTKAKLNRNLQMHGLIPAEQQSKTTEWRIMLMSF